MAAAAGLPRQTENSGVILDGIKLNYEHEQDGLPFKITGNKQANSITVFDDPQLGFNERLLLNIKNANYQTPSIIQRHAIPQIVANNDVMCVSHTGSGKTATYLLPLIDSIYKRKNGSGAPAKTTQQSCSHPAALILVPTRELAEQVDEMAKQFSRSLKIRCFAVYGGHSLPRELNALKTGTIDVLVATPGRMIHLLEEFTVTSLTNVEYLVIDEADEMFNRGFFPQIMAIVRGHMGPLEERKNIMFSATFPHQIQYFAKKYLRNEYIFVVVGVLGGASPDIQQHVISVDEVEKLNQLETVLTTFDEKVIIFCNTIEKVSTLTPTLRQRGYKCGSIHSEHSQFERDETLKYFNEGKIKYLIATSVASRGLNIEGFCVVVNYDFPTDINEYVQRIGRSRKANNNLDPTSVSFFDQDRDIDILNDLIMVLEQAQQNVPSFLLELRAHVNTKSVQLAEEHPFADEDVLNKIQKSEQSNQLLQLRFDESDFFG